MNAKREADEHLQESNLTYTIVRPGSPTDEPATGRSEVAERVERGEIARVEVARTPVTALNTENTDGKTFEMIGGDEPIEVALQSLAWHPPSCYPHRNVALAADAGTRVRRIVLARSSTQLWPIVYSLALVCRGRLDDSI